MHAVRYYEYEFSNELTVAPVRMYTNINTFHHKKRPDLRDGSFFHKSTKAIRS